MVCDMARGRDKREKVELWMLCVNGKVDESGQIRLLTFEENSSWKMRVLGSGSFIVIVVLDVDKFINLRRGWNMISVDRFEKSLKRLFRRVEG